jgi:hypothetical protein
VSDLPETRFTRSGEVEITYQVWGAGPDMVVIPGFATHLDVLWELPELAAFLDRLGRFGRAGTHHDQESNRTAAAALIPNGAFVLLPGAEHLRGSVRS